MRAIDLARELGLSPGRISQLVADGRLDGCYSGSGRSRVFDATKVADALNRKLDKGQLLGNGAQTKKALDRLSSGDPAPKADAELPVTDASLYELNRAQKLAEEVKKLRRANALEEGTMVLASSVERRVAKMVGQEISAFDTVLREAARAVADEMGVDARAVRKILVDQWRAYRGERTQTLSDQADRVEMDDDERKSDVD